MYDQSRYPSQPFNPHRLTYQSGPQTGLFNEVINCLSVGGMPLSLVWVQLCAIASLLAQGVADVMWPNGHRSPVGVSGLVVGHSGCGKSYIYHLLMAAIEEFFQHAPIDNAAARASPLIEDATLPALMAHLKAWRYAALFSDDAGALIHLQRAAATLAKLSDGTPLRSSRIKSGLIELTNHRFVMLQLMQPGVAERSTLFSTRADQEGLANRCLLSLDTPVVGSMHQLHLTPLLAMRHGARAFELLTATMQNAMIKPAQLPAIQLAPDAIEFFEHIANEAKRQSLAARVPPNVREYLARHGERTLRTGGAVHLYNLGLDGLNQRIPLPTMQAAEELTHDSINVYQRLSYRPTQVQKDALTIVQALHNHCARIGSPHVKLSELRRQSANLGLTRARVDRALPEMVIAGHALIISSGKEDYVQLIAAPVYSPRHLQ